MRKSQKCYEEDRDHTMKKEIKDGMKHRVWVKVVAFLLLCIFMYLAVAGSWLGVVMWKRGVYDTSKEEIVEQEMESLTRGSGYNYLYNYLMSGDEQVLENVRYDNLEIEIIAGLSPYATEGVGQKESLVAYEQVYSLGDFISPYSTADIASEVVAGNAELEKIIVDAAQIVAAQEAYESESAYAEEVSKQEVTTAYAEDVSDQETATEYAEVYVIDEEQDFSEFITYEIRTVVYVDTEYENIDQYFFLAKGYDVMYAAKDVIWLVVGGSVLLAMVFFVFLIKSAGYRRGKKEVVVCGTARIPYDICILLFTSVGAPPLILGAENFYYGDAYGSYIEGMIGIAGIVGACGVAILFLLDLIVRCKTKTLWSNILLVKIWKKVELFRRIKVLARMCVRCAYKIGKTIPLIWKGILLYGVVVLWSLPMLGFYDFFWRVVCWMILSLVLVLIFGYSYLMFRKLQLASKSLGEGDLSHHVDTKYFLWEFKDMGESLNSIAKGMEVAVNEKLKSERMKTELISNVSHDIKTPLTSIVNYADLISKEETDNEKIHEYSAVLLRQSERLKRLTEDLVHASKVSSGNVEVQLTLCDIGVLLNQAIGEYEEKLAQSKLELVLKQPKEITSITVDGRHMWRVFDNLLNNICKYAQEGTRVYIEVKEAERKVQIIFKNISKYELNITEEELMERFVRGDKSRHSEGNGLGLSIARSLVEVQGGSMKLAIDGDLFKVILRF